LLINKIIYKNSGVFCKLKPFSEVLHKSCQHLSLAERYYIQVERKKKVSQSKIAQAAGRSQDTPFLENVTVHQGGKKISPRPAGDERGRLPQPMKLADLDCPD
jgi:hypothetical protein